MTTWRVLGRNLPAAGGGWLRALPPFVMHRAIRTANTQGRPAITYVHPWEVDPGPAGRVDGDAPGALPSPPEPLEDPRTAGRAPRPVRLRDGDRGPRDRGVLRRASRFLDVRRTGATCGSPAEPRFWTPRPTCDRSLKMARRVMVGGRAHPHDEGCDVRGVMTPWAETGDPDPSAEEVPCSLVPVQLVGVLLLTTCGGSSGTPERISGVVPPGDAAARAPRGGDHGPGRGSRPDRGVGACSRSPRRARRERPPRTRTSCGPPASRSPRHLGRHDRRAELARARRAGHARRRSPSAGSSPAARCSSACSPCTAARTGDLGTAAGGRVAGRDVPATPPPSAILLNGPATLSQPGATYLLTQDVTTAGTAFTITAPGVTLDLGGTPGRLRHAARGTQHGVTMQHVAGGGRTDGTERHDRAGRRLVARARTVCSSGTWTTCASPTSTSPCPGRTPWACTLTEHGTTCASTTARSPAARPSSRTATIPGVTAIFVEDAPGAVEIDQNLVTREPPVGHPRRRPLHHGPSLVHHNRVQGTKALVANGYMLGMAKPRPRRVREPPGGRVARDPPQRHRRQQSRRVGPRQPRRDPGPDRTPSTPTAHWTHGIKIEGAPARARRAQRRHGPRGPGARGGARASTSTWASAQGIVVRGNRVEAVSFTSALEATAVYWTYGSDGPTNDIVVRTTSSRRPTASCSASGTAARAVSSGTTATSAT